MLVATIAMLGASIGVAGASDDAIEDANGTPAAAANGDEPRADPSETSEKQELDAPEDEVGPELPAETADEASQTAPVGEKPDQGDENRNDRGNQAGEDGVDDGNQPGSEDETTDADVTVYAKALNDHDCDAGEWHFVITQVADDDYPDSVSMTWANGESGAATFDKYTGSTAHYVSKANLDSTVAEASAELPSDWSGQLNLSHGPCDGDDGDNGDDEEPGVTPELGFTTVEADCVADEAVIEFRVEGTFDDDGVTVSLLDGETEVGTAAVDFGPVTDGDGFVAGGEFDYPATVTAALTLSVTIGDTVATADVPAAPECDEDEDEDIDVLPDTDVPDETDTDTDVPDDTDTDTDVPDDTDTDTDTDTGTDTGTDVDSEVVVNIPVIDRQPVNAPVQPVVRPTSVVNERGPAVLGSTSTRGQLARTGTDSAMLMAPFGLALLLMGFALQRSSRRRFATNR